MSNLCSRSILTVLILFASDASGSEYAGRGGSGSFSSVYRVQCKVVNLKTKKEVSVDVGTAFGHKSGNALSANHVIDKCIKIGGTLRLLSADESDSPATVVSQDATLDLVLLKPNEGFVKNPIPIRANDTFAMGSQVSSWGFPAGYTDKVPLLMVGYLAGVSPDPSDAKIKRWVVNAAINMGNSGGPLLETVTPSVIGVVILKYNPLTSEVGSQLKKLSENGGAETRVLAQAMIDIAERSQLVVGQAVMISDLRAFLQQAGVEP